jgi:hypothetical protein
LEAPLASTVTNTSLPFLAAATALNWSNTGEPAVMSSFLATSSSCARGGGGRGARQGVSGREEGLPGGWLQLVAAEG